MVKDKTVVFPVSKHDKNLTSEMETIMKDKTILQSGAVMA